MKVYERGELQTRMIRNLRARTSDITYFGPGPVRSFLYAVATELQHLYYRLFRADLKQDAQRALGADLDEIGEARGVARLGAARSSAVLTFSGTAGTVVPLGFAVQGASGVTYTTTEATTLVLPNSLATVATGRAVAESATAGAGSMVERGSLTTITVPLTGLASVTNEAPSRGGRDQETDDQYRGRIVRYLAGLNQGTQAFYEAAVREANPLVTRLYLSRGPGAHTINIAVATRSGATLSGSQLQAIADALAPKTPIQTVVTLSNLTWTDLTVTVTGSVKPGYTAAQVTSALAQNLSDFLDWGVWPFGEAVQWDDLLAIVSNTTGMDAVASFSPTTNLSVGVGSLPRLVSVQFTDATSQQVTTATGITRDALRLQSSVLY